MGGSFVILSERCASRRSPEQFCPLCRAPIGESDAVRAHLIADHKRTAAQADELAARFDTAKPIPDPEGGGRYCAWSRYGAGGEPGGRPRAAQERVE